VENTAEEEEADNLTRRQDRARCRELARMNGDAGDVPERLLAAADSRCVVRTVKGCGGSGEVRWGLGA
jgi:hypothetical protein